MARRGAPIKTYDAKYLEQFDRLMALIDKYVDQGGKEEIKDGVESSKKNASRGALDFLSGEMLSGHFASVPGCRISSNTLKNYVLRQLLDILNESVVESSRNTGHEGIREILDGKATHKYQLYLDLPDEDTVWDRCFDRQKNIEEVMESFPLFRNTSDNAMRKAIQRVFTKHDILWILTSLVSEDVEDSLLRYVDCLRNKYQYDSDSEFKKRRGRLLHGVAFHEMLCKELWEITFSYGELIFSTEPSDELEENINDLGNFTEMLQQVQEVNQATLDVLQGKIEHLSETKKRIDEWQTLLTEFEAIWYLTFAVYMDVLAEITFLAVFDRLDLGKKESEVEKSWEDFKSLVAKFNEKDIFEDAFLYSGKRKKVCIEMAKEVNDSLVAFWKLKMARNDGLNEKKQEEGLRRLLSFLITGDKNEFWKELEEDDYRFTGRPKMNSLDEALNCYLEIIRKTAGERNSQDLEKLYLAKARLVKCWWNVKNI